MEKYTKNGRNMESMNRYDIIDYLGMDEKMIYQIINGTKS